METIEQWVCTDPDNLQYCIRTGDRSWKFKEFHRQDYQDTFSQVAGKGITVVLLYWDDAKYWLEDEVNLDNYDEEAMYDHVCHYYPWDEFQELLKSSPDVIAECIFEQENGMY